jgi:hypothetical protein
MQERLLPAMNNPELVLEKCRGLMISARTLDVPISASEQYPKGLGPTVADLREGLGNAPVFEKTAFSCWRDDALKAHLIRLHEAGRPQLILAGIEAHVCVLQTAIDAAQAGFAVYVVADAVSSRREESIRLGLARMRQFNVQVVNTEMAMFELLGKAGTARFKTLSGLIR